MPKVEKIGSSVSIDVFRDLLAGQLSFESAIKKIKAETTFQPTEDRMPPTYALLFAKYHPLPGPTCLKIVRSGNCESLSPALQLFFKIQENRWRVEPYLLKPSYFKKEDGYAIQVRENWVNLLLECVESEFEAASKLAAKSGRPDFAGINLELSFDKACHDFEMKGPLEFFTDEMVGRKWVIISRWDEWNQDQLTLDKRLERLKKEKYGTGSDNFRKICRHFGLQLPNKNQG